MQKIRLSVIIPVYNTEPYLAECLDSALASTRCDYEVLAIDDGSADRSGALLAAYAERNDRVRIFSQENRGLSATRNRGMREARGDHLLFLDSDDSLVPGSLDRLLAQLEEAPVAETDLLRVEVEGSEPSFFPAFLSPSEAAEEFLCRCKKNWPAVLYVVRREWVAERGLCFAEGCLHEDVLWSTELLALARSVYRTGIVSYRQRAHREGSITAAPNPKRLQDVCALVKRGQEAILSSSLEVPVQQKVCSRLTQSITTLLWLYYRMDAEGKAGVSSFLRENPAVMKRGKSAKTRLFRLGCALFGFSLTMRLLKPILDR